MAPWYVTVLPPHRPTTDVTPGMGPGGSGVPTQRVRHVGQYAGIHHGFLDIGDVGPQETGTATGRH